MFIVCDFIVFFPDFITFTIFLIFKKCIYFYINFKGYIPFTVTTKYWLYPPCCMIHPWAYLAPNSLYLPLPLYFLSSQVVTTSLFSVHVSLHLFRYIHWFVVFFRFYIWVISMLYLSLTYDLCMSNINAIFVIDLWLRLTQCPPSPSMLLQMADFFLFNGWVIFHAHTHRPHFLYPFISWWTARMLSIYLGCYNNAAINMGCTCLFKLVFVLGYIPGSGIAGSYVVLFLVFHFRTVPQWLDKFIVPP